MNDAWYGVYGTGGFGRVVMALARAKVLTLGLPLDQLVFIDDEPHEDMLNGHRVFGWSDFLAMKASSRYVVIAIANSTVRERLALQLAKNDVKAWTVCAENVVILDKVMLGEGAVLSPFVTLTSNISIGCHFQAALYSHVGHDCVIGDFVTFGPRVSCNGNVVIEDHAYIGTGAKIKQGQPGKPLIIGRGAVVGMGAVVTKSVPPGVTVIGNPARPMTKIE